MELPDITAGTPDRGKQPKHRLVPLLVTDDQGRPIHDQRWSQIWRTWREAAGWPDEGTFHSLPVTMNIDAQVASEATETALSRLGEQFH
ncbi:hypothetical protein [Micromonospora sp. U21]|uniref:hypothetical protein n=1 Tax=Micromonospora sp. U21 TaxID=2824899 RepID=UPI001FFD6A69|nr:hypothetical protein [Micromonospora sp. U21]